MPPAKKIDKIKRRPLYTRRKEHPKVHVGVLAVWPVLTAKSTATPLTVSAVRAWLRTTVSFSLQVECCDLDFSIARMAVVRKQI